jgi:hypothetical protein
MGFFVTVLELIIKKSKRTFGAALPRNYYFHLK